MLIPPIFLYYLYLLHSSGGSTLHEKVQATNFPSTEIKREGTETPTVGTLSRTHSGWETVLETEYY